MVHGAVLCCAQNILRIEIAITGILGVDGLHIIARLEFDATLEKETSNNDIRAISHETHSVTFADKIEEIKQPGVEKRGWAPGLGDV
jgi:hypothetical protein